MTPPPRGYCPVCGKAVALRNGGLVREHRPRSGAPTCQGSGNPGLASLAAVARRQREQWELHRGAPL